MLKLIIVKTKHTGWGIGYKGGGGYVYQSGKEGEI